MANFKTGVFQLCISDFEKCPNGLESLVVKKFMNLVAEFVFLAKFHHRQRRQTHPVNGQQLVIEPRPLNSFTAAAYLVARSTFITGTTWKNS